MDRHKLGQVRQQVEELLRHGSPSCIRQAHSTMVENFESVLWFALDSTEPEPKPKHTIADNYPAGGLTATEPCIFCEDHEALQSANKRLRETLGATNTFLLRLEAISICKKISTTKGHIYSMRKKIKEALKETP